MRAVVVGQDGEPALAEVPEPDGPGEVVRILACGLCGSDVEKLDSANAGVVLGHEVVAARDDGRRVALVHHAPCGACERCLAGHESTCTRFAEPTIRPGGFAERASAEGWVELPEDWPDWRGTMVEPLACVLRGAEAGARRGVSSSSGTASSAGCSDACSSAAVRRCSPSTSTRVAAAGRRTALWTRPSLSGRGGVETALAAVAPGGTVLVFADAGPIPAFDVYRRELTVVGVRSAAPAYMPEAVSLLHDLDVPEPVVLPLDRFAEGLELYRRRDALKVVFAP